MQIIEQILTEAKNNKWPYPKTLDALIEAGVTSYTVRFEDSYEAVYQGTFGTWKEPAPNGYRHVVTAKAFDAKKVQKAIMEHIEKNTAYTEVLVELAASGVSHYRVDTAGRTVTYYDDDETEHYVEAVPNL